MANYNLTQTGAEVQAILNRVAAGYIYMGTADLTTTPDTTNPNVCYLLTAVGTYTNFGNIQHASGIGIALWNGTAWSYQNVPSAAVVQTDATPTANSTKPVQSGGVYNALMYSESTETLEEQGTRYRNVYVGNDTSIGQIGEIVTSTSMNAYAAEIQLPEGAKSLTFYLRIWNGDFGYAFFNENNQVINYKAYKDISGVAISNYELAVPSGAKYVHLSLYSAYRSVTIKTEKSIKSEITDLSNKVDELQGETNELFTPLGSPIPYISSLETTGLSLFTDSATLYSAWDALATANPNWLKKETNLGMDASNTYEVRYYTMQFQNKQVNSARDLSGTNSWSDSTFKMRRVLLVMGVHPTEQPSILGGYLAIKEILESNEEWAQYIKSNFIIDIVPCVNPWGLNNNSADNSNGVNLNRDYNSSTPQAETAEMKTLITDLKAKGLMGVVDCHNCAYNKGGYLVAKTTYTHYKYYAKLAQYIQGLMYAPLNSVFGTTENNHFHLWTADGTNGQLHQYCNDQEILGCTFEIATAASIQGALLTKSIAANLLATFGSYIG